jgi:hypothetical protein
MPEDVVFLKNWLYTERNCPYIRLVTQNTSHIWTDGLNNGSHQQKIQNVLLLNKCKCTVWVQTAFWPITNRIQIRGFNHTQWLVWLHCMWIQGDEPKNTTLMISAWKVLQFMNTNWFSSTTNSHEHISVSLQSVPLQCSSSLLELFQGKLYLWVKTTSCSETDNSCLQTYLNTTALQCNIYNT